MIENDAEDKPHWLFHHSSPQNLGRSPNKNLGHKRASSFGT